MLSHILLYYIYSLQLAYTSQVITSSNKIDSVFIILIDLEMDTQEKIQVCQLPKRMRGPYSGTRFQKVQIITNFYHVQVQPINEIHIFRLKITPPIPLDDRATRSQLLQSTIAQIKSHISDPIFSGFNIYSTRSPTQKQFTVSTATHQLSIKEVKILNVKDNPQILVQFLNNGLRNLMTKLKYIELGRSGKYFNTQNKQKIQNLFMFSGYKANFLQLQRGIYLRVDTAKKIVRNQSVLQYIDQFYRNNADKSKQQKRQILKQELINKIVMTNYGRPRYLKILDIAFEDIDSVRLSDKQCSIREYYSNKYKLQIQNSKQPLLVVEGNRKNEDKVYLIPQICLMTGIPDDFDQYKRKKISEVTIKSADNRKMEISRLIEEIKNTSEVNSLKQMGIKINSEMQRFKAKIIPPPRISLGRNQKIQSGKQSFFNLFAQPIFASKHSLKVAVIYFKSADIRQLLDVCQQTSQRLGVQFKPQKICVGDFDSRRAINIIDDALYKAVDKYECNSCLIIIPVQLKSQYKVLKQKCLLKNQIVSQIATQATLRKNGLRSIATKILLQMIAKRGNTLWVPQSAQKLERVMLAAFDTGKCGGKNTMCGVATLNSTFSSICSKTQQFKDINDKMNCMLTLTLKLIDAFVNRNKQPPKQIIMFSNSCSNDQITLHQQYMISPLLSKLDEIYKQNRPAVTVVMVNTKTNQRFFQAQGSGVKNVPAGTIVSQNIVSNNYDFFMISQFATRGSTVPNHYKVIHTDSKMQQGVLQQLIYSQCFNYVNWTGSIKVPGILQYAKKCMKFNTEVLENKRICEQLETKLYFI